MHQLKRSVVAAAVAGICACTMSAANAESIIFPYWSTQNGDISVLSLSAGSDVAPNSATGKYANNIHYVWNYGSSCTHFDNYGSLTPNDLIQQFVSQAADTPALFGDKSTPAYFPPTTGGSYGFLVVTDNAGVAGGTMGPAGSLRGQMVIASASSGIVTAYSGIPAPVATIGGPNTPRPEGDFRPHIGGGPYAYHLVDYRLSWYPQSAVNTSWFAVVLGDMSYTIQHGLDWIGAAQYTTNGGVYGRDEDAYSGTTTGQFTCSTLLTPSSFMNSAQMSSVSNGGLANVTFTPGLIQNGTFTPGDTGGLYRPSDIALFKIESTNALGSPSTFITKENAVSNVGSGTKPLS